MRKAEIEKRKELEAFNRVCEDCSKLDLDYVSKHNLMDDLREIKQAITPPTAAEVCKALSEYFGEEVIFLVNDKEFVIKCNIGYKYIVETDDVLYYTKVGLPLYLITLIGRFYEGEIK